MIVCITGANRGIGLEFCHQLLKRDQADLFIFATAREPEGATELASLAKQSAGRLEVLKLDVAREDSVADFARIMGPKLADGTLDLLINNAGIFADEGRHLNDFDFKAFQRSFDVNTLGPLRVIGSLFSKISRPGGKVINVTSLMGSIADNGSGGYYAYRSSKAALNMLNKSLAIDHPEMISVVMHPGWVQTDMGGQNAPLTPQVSVASMLRVIGELTNKNTGSFLNYDGAELPW